MQWTDPEVEQQISGDASKYDAIRGAFLFQEVNSELMALACELAALEGDMPDAHDSAAFIDCLTRSQVPPVVVLRWVGLSLGIGIPKEIDAAVERLRTMPA